MPLSHTLNLCQSPTELNDVHGSDYYWYLRSREFVFSFFFPMASVISKLVPQRGKLSEVKVLDVGCGEGLLAQVLPQHHAYRGFDGSLMTINKLKETLPWYPEYNFDCKLGRIEDPPEFDITEFDLAVFGGLLSVLVKPECHIEFIEFYRKKYGLKYAVVFDLEQLNVNPLLNRWKCVCHYHASVDLNIQEVKKHRKFYLFDLGRKPDG